MTDRENPKRASASPPDWAPGPITRWLTPVTRWIITNFVAPPCVFLLFGLLNRTRVYGRRRIRHVPNTLVLSNHQSMIDSFPIAYYLFFPEKMFRPELAPWNAAAAENFFKNPFFAWVFHQFQCIPVRRGRRDLSAMIRSASVLRAGILTFFPEGTRSRDGRVGRGRAGAGMVILQTRPQVVPITLEGLDRVLPIGSRLPRIGQRVSIYVGRPVPYDDLAAEGRSRKNAQQIVDRVMERIAFQQRVLRRLHRRRP